jgi:hypothetical protein
LSNVIFAGYGLSDSLRDDYEGLNVSGKIVMILGGFPPGYVQAQITKKNFNSFAKVDAALKHGAVAILSIQEDFPRNKPLSEPGLMYRNYYQEQISPAFFIYQKNCTKDHGRGLRPSQKGSPRTRSYATDIFLSFKSRPSHFRVRMFWDFLKAVT